MKSHGMQGMHGMHCQYTNMIDLVSECHEQTSVSHLTPIYLNHFNITPQSDDLRQYFTDQRNMTSLLATAKSRNDDDNVTYSSAGKDEFSLPFSLHSQQHLQMCIPSQSSDATLPTHNVASLPRQLRHNDVRSPQGSSVTRSFGPAGMITVTPLTARRLNTRGIATVTVATSGRPNNELRDMRNDNNHDVINTMANEVVESKATVYDDIISI